MSGFCQISSSAGPSQKCQFWVKFSTRLQISGCCQISSFAGPEKFKSLNFEPNVWRNWKFLDCAKFHPVHVVSSQKCQFWANFWHKSKFLDFAKCYPSQVRSGQNLDCKPNFQRDWKYLDFAIFHPSQVWSGQKSAFLSQNFNTNQNFSWILSKFYPLLVQEWATLSIFEPNFQHNRKFLDCAKISSFACPEWSKLLILGLILIAIENYSRILPHFILCIVF